MNFTPSKGSICLFLLGALSQIAGAQDVVGQLKNDVRNTFSQQPAAAYPPAASTANTTERPTGNQFRATSAIGGWAGHRITAGSGAVLAGPEATPVVEGSTTVKLPADANGVKLQSAQFGRGLNVRTPDAYFGDILPPPNVDDQGLTVDGLTAYYAQPNNNGDFYYSAASNQVFASQAGVVIVEWRLKTADPAEVRIVPVPYIVAASSNPAKEAPRRIYWTKNGYKGLPIKIPDSIKVNIRYNREVPQIVAKEFNSPYETQINRAPAQIVTQTVWRDLVQLHAYNLEGMVLMELLDSDNRFLGTQVIQIIREAPVVLVKADIGSRLFSFPKNETLRPQVVTGQLGTSFVDLIGMPSRNEIHLYATRTTSVIPDDSLGNPRASGELTVFWLQKSLGEIEWPMIFNSYIISWPSATAQDAYTTFVRQPGSDGDSEVTAVRLDPTNNPNLLFQDDPFGTQTKLVNGNQLYTLLTGDRDGFSLIRHQIGEEVWYERIHSVVSEDQPSYNERVEAVVGARLSPPESFTISGASTTVGSRTLTLPSITGLVVGMGISGPGIALGTTLSAVPSPTTAVPIPTTVTLSSAATATTLLGATLTKDSTSVTLASPTTLTIGTAVAGPGLVTGTTITAIPTPTSLTLSAAATSNVSVSAGNPVSITLSLGQSIGYVRLRPKAGLSGAGLTQWKYRSAYDPTAFIDPFSAGFDAAKMGAVIPVNARSETTADASYQDELEVWWYKASQPPAGSSSLKPNYYPARTMVYQLAWPSDAEKIILASNKGSGPLVAPQATGRIYYENNETNIGFNPNDEHALLLGDSAWAIRDDLGTAKTSRPFVLLRYTAADARPAMRVFQVQREDLDLVDPIQFNYKIEAGKIVQGPMPLSLLKIPTWPDSSAPKNFEEAPTATPNPSNTTASKPAHYAGYTIQDRKGNLWCYRGPHTNEDAASVGFQLKFFYPFQSSFYIPGVSSQPAVGTAMPYLRDTPSSGNTEAHAVDASNRSDKNSLAIRYQPSWPKFAPVLRMGETHTLPRFGLPAVRGQTSVSVIYEQKLANEDGGSSVTLFDPTVAKTSGMEDAGLTDAGNMKIPAGVYSELYQGKYYFPNLPPHLSERFFINPNVGSKGSAVLIGKFFDEALGADYLQLNVLTTKDVKYLKDLCPTADEDKLKWNKLIDDLSVSATRYVENTKKPGTFIPATSATVEARITAVWNYINTTNWSTKSTPPTAAELATATSQPAADLQTAVDWIKSKFVELAANQKKRTGSTAQSNEGNALKSAFDMHMTFTSPDKTLYFTLGNNTFSSVSYTQYRTTGLRTAPQFRGVDKLATQQAAYLTEKAQVAKLKDWIFKQEAAGTDGSTPTERKWSTDGVTINLPTLRVEDLKTKAFTSAWAGELYSFPATLRPRDFVKFNEASTETDVPATLREKAFKFIEAKRPELVKWDKSVSAPTPGTADLAGLRSDYENAEKTAATAVGATEVVEVTHPDVAVDSYALTADGGEGWVTLMMGNGKAFTPKAEPVSMYVIRVSKPLGAGEIKVVASSNPLSESLTLQSSLDFAGKPEKYEFEWRTLPPVDGLPPAIYSFQRELAVGNGSWSMKDSTDVVSSVVLPANVRLVGSAAGTTPVVNPIVSAERIVNLTSLPYRAFISIQLDALDSMRVSINGTAVVLKNFPDSQDSVTTSRPLTSFAPLPLLYEVPVSALKVGDNTIALELGTTAVPGSSSLINCRLETMVQTDLSSTWTSVTAPDEVAREAGEDASTNGASKAKNSHTIEGTSLFTLTDNYFIYRYRAIKSGHDAYEPAAGWSNWTEPQLGEGWIKRALAGINPFEQRMKNLYSNTVNTDVSLVTQAGKRWEGDVPLSLANINNFGLIEIYETILRRGKGLSIEGAPPLTYGPANDALLLAAGYLNDLYMILGNEAYADAQNSTIAYGTDSGQFGETASAQFAFKGQLASVLDEELTLLRGRDDFFAPGTRVTPVFNRLIWNYTRGIASGEVVYALNYNIKDLNADGSVNAADAAKAYPQGHGDAYGHYLMSLKNYYSLLWNPYFNWIPRIEAVLVLGKPVSVDYLDERKFAGAAAAWTRTTAQTLDLTYRQSYNPAAKGSPAVDGDASTAVNPTWAHLGNVRSNNRTAVTRTWGVDDWAVRGGQGAFFHWLSASAMLPEVDPDPNHEGIQKIDRSTVAEIGEIASQAEAIQRLLDNADQHLNPLGLSDGAVPFDVSVNVATDEVGQPHYEQIYDRALGALTNASAAFDRAKGATALLRDQDESLDAQRDAINTQERAFEAQLVDLYGTPYADDIGPGKLYAQGYSGPDLLHYMYVDMPELFKNSGDDDLSEQRYRLVGDTNFAKAIDNIDAWTDYSKVSGDKEDKLMLAEENNENPPTAGLGDTVSFTLNGNGQFRKPTTWAGRRSQPGAIQQAASSALMARLELSNALEDFNDFVMLFRRAARNYQSVVKAHTDERSRMVRWNAANQSITSVLAAIDLGFSIKEEVDKLESNVNKSLSEVFPTVNGVANDATSAARAAVYVAAGAQDGVELTINVIRLAVTQALNSTLAGLESDHEFQAFDIAWRAEHLQMIADLKDTFEGLEDGTRTVDMALRSFNDANDNMRTLIAQGDTIQREREHFRRRAAAIVQGYRTKDLGFRTFRDEALESYRSLFDLASRYTYLASRAYDYETALLDPVRSTKAKGFLQDIVKSRAVGVFADGVPQQASSTTGDPGLSGVLARMNADWSVAKHRLGINNPARNQTVFSLRREMKRVDPGADGDVPWKDYLATCRRANLLADEDVKRHCLNINPRNLLTVPGYVIEFSTTIEEGVNFFGNPLMGGDQTFSPSAFTTKIRYSGIGLKGYIGMASPTSIGGSIESPNDPGTGFSDPNALSATPYIYFIPSGFDSMRAPSNTDTNIIRSWMIEDQAIPLPFDIGGAFNSSNAITGFGTLREQFTLRKHGAFRAVPGDTVFSSATNFTSTRLISRSVWNSKWKIVIPGSTLLAEPINGMAKFLQQVKDIQIYFDSYSAAGN